MPRLVNILLFFYCLNIFSQDSEKENTILVFSTEPGFLRPYIETILKELKDTRTNKVYFQKVYSLNSFDEDTEIRAKISRILWQQENAPNLISIRPVSQNEIDFQDEIVNKLTQYDYFLTIKTNTLGELIEFQFQLFSTLKSENNSKKNYLKRVLIDNEIAVENFFINPKQQNYLIEIKNAIERLFQNSNKTPIADIVIFDKRVKNGDTILVAKESTVKIDGSNSGDYDSEKIHYSWRNIPHNNEKYQTFNKISLEDSVPIQNIQIDKDGPLKIGFTVSDGVTQSEEIKINLITKERTNSIKVSDSSFFTVVKKKDWRESNINFTHHFSLENLNYSENDTPIILVSNKKIGGKLLVSNVKHIVDTLKIDLYKKPLRRFPFERRYYESSMNFFKSNNANELYLYTMDNDSLLSKPTVLKHRTYLRQGFTLKFVGSLSSLTDNAYAFQDNPNDSIGDGISSVKMKLGGYFFNNLIEIGLSIPIQRLNRLKYKNYEFLYPESASIYSLYHFYPENKGNGGFINLYGGLNFKFYKFKSLEENQGSPSYFTYGLSPELGVRFRLITTNYFDLKFCYGGTIDTFLERNFSSLNGDFTIDMGIQCDF